MDCQKFQLNKKNANVWHNLGTLYYDQGEFFKARDCLNKALRIDDTPVYLKKYNQKC
jgi:tetratricopeptide (TPR) repeat protein